MDAVAELVSFPFYSWNHAVVVPKNHALASHERISLEAIAEHPIITYHEGFTGRAKLDETFARAGLAPDVVMSALDADVIKTYVELGLGVGIIASLAFNPAKDTALRLLDCGHIFEQNTTKIAVHKGHYLRGYAYRFIEQCSPALGEAVIRRAVAPAKDVDIE